MLSQVLRSAHLRCELAPAAGRKGLDVLLKALLLAVAGFVIGIFSGLLGVGGGTMVVPVLRLGFGLEAVCATATSLFTIIFTSIGGTVTHLRNKTTIPLLSLCLGLGGAVTSSIGAMLGTMSPGWAVMLAAAAVILYSGYTMLSKALKLPKSAPKQAATPGPAAVGGKGEPAKPAAAATPPQAGFTLTWKKALGGFAIGLAAGLASGYVGVGGGFIMVPLMVSLLGVPMCMASGTSLLAIMILAIPGVATQIALGNVDFVAGLFIAVGSIPGAMFGARFVKRIPERQLRFIFAGFLAVAAVCLLANELFAL